jgi:uncharacterized protein
MNFAEIRRTLETASPLPEEELRAALAHTDELLPLVVALIDKLKAGVYLLPDQQWLLVYGIHVLAAARKTAFWPAWRDLLRLPDAVATLFGENAVPVIAAVTLSLAGDDADEIFALLDTGPEGEPGAAGFQVLARMTWDGRIPLARSRAFLEYFEQEECAAPDDSVWVGWVDAVVLLGLTELAPAIARVLAKPVFDDLDPADRTETLAMLAAAAGDFADGDRFLAEGIAPFADPVEGLAWLRASTILETPASAPDADEVPDPAAAIRLSGDEEIWLSGFLDSEQVPATTMNLEALDGFFSALAAGPAPIPAAEYLPLIWGSAAAGRKPAYADAAQQNYVENLLDRYRETIARRVAENVAVEPFLFDDERGDELARDWGSGFMLGVEMRPRAWAPLTRHRSAGRLLGAMTALYDDDPEDGLTPDLRRKLVESLPEIVLDIANFWRDPSHGLAQPIRTEKIGRNDPCPCGSGKKYKKCCGAGGAAA